LPEPQASSLKKLVVIVGVDLRNAPTILLRTLDAMDIVKKQTPHKRKGRNGRKPEAIVIHISTGSLASCDNWFADPQSYVSAHYCVGKAGQVHQYVDEKDTAYHAGTIHQPTAQLIIDNGKANPNHYTIGIEHEGKATDEWTDAMYLASAELIAAICKRWQIPCDADHIIPHRAIRSNKTCPGFKVDLEKLITLAAAYSSPGESTVEG